MTEAIKLYAIRNFTGQWFAKRTRTQYDVWVDSADSALFFVDQKLARKKLTIAARGYAADCYPVIVCLDLTETQRLDYSVELEKNQARAAKAQVTATANSGKRLAAELERQLAWDKQNLARREEEIRRLKGE